MVPVLGVNIRAFRPSRKIHARRGRLPAPRTGPRAIERCWWLSTPRYWWWVRAAGRRLLVVRFKAREGVRGKSVALVSRVKERLAIRVGVWGNHPAIIGR